MMQSALVFLASVGVAAGAATLCTRRSEDHKMMHDWVDWASVASMAVFGAWWLALVLL